MPTKIKPHNNPLAASQRFNRAMLAVIIAGVLVVSGIIFFYATRAAATLQPVARMVKGNTHLYTISSSEVSSAQAAGWTLEDRNYFFASPNSQGEWTTMVIRLNYNGGQDFLYTTSTTEASNARANGWTQDGPAFYVGSSSSWGARPVYRLFNPSFGHFYTVSVSERNTAVSNGWTDQGIGFYAYSSTNPAPAPPTNLRVTAITSNSATLAWNSPSGGAVSSYVLQVVGGGTGYLVGPYGCCSGTTYELKPSTSYTFNVMTESNGNRSSLSNSVTATTSAIPPTPNPSTPPPTPTPTTSKAPAPTAPSNLKVDSATNNSLRLTWSASVPASGSSISNYQIINSAGAVIATSTSTSYTVGALSSCATYAFTVKAVNNQGTSSAASGSASGSTSGCAPNQTPPPKPSTAPTQPKPTTKPGSTATNTADTTPPTPPSDFEAKLAEDGALVELVWRAASDDRKVVGYKVERTANQKDWNTLAEVVDDTRYIDATTKFETAYMYRLRARDEAGNMSSEVLAQITTGKFTANISETESSTLESDDGVVSVTIPTGAVPGDQVCAVVDSKDYNEKINQKKYHLLAGPYMLACKSEDGDVLPVFGQPVGVTFKVTAEQDKKYDLGLYEYSGDIWGSVSQAKYDKKTRVFTFSQTNANTFALLGSAKSNPWPLILSIVIPLVLFFVGFVYIRLRQQKQAEYQEYLKRKYYDF